jgi:hypothetical protein
MSLILAVFAVAAQQKPVDFFHPAAPVPIVLESLGRSLEMELTAEGAVANREIYVRVTELEPERLLASVASATGGEWRTTRRGRHLVPDRKRVAEARASVRSEQVQQLEKAIAEAGVDSVRSPEETATLQARLAVIEAEDSPATGRELQQFGRQDAGTRLVRRLAKVVGPAALADIETGERVVWSLRPTAVQRALPDSARAAFEAYQQEAKAQNAGLAKHPSAEDKWDRPALLREADRVLPEEALFVVRRDMGTLEATVTSASPSSPVHIGGSLSPSWTARPAPTVLFEVPDFEVVPSELATIVGKCIMPSTVRLTEAEVGFGRRHALEAETSDLWQTPATEVFDQMVEATGLDAVIGFETMDAVSYFAPRTPAPWKPRAMLERFLSPDWRSVSLKDGLLVSGPSTWSLADPPDPHRKGAAMIAEACEDGRFDLDDLATTTAFHADGSGFQTSKAFVRELYEMGGSARFIDPLGDQALRLYGRLPDMARASARQDGYEARAATLPPLALTELRRMAYLSGYVSLPGGQYADSTVALPRGVPSQTTLRVRVESKPSIVAVSIIDGAILSVVATGHDDVAGRVAWAERNGAGWSKPLFALGEAETLDVRLDFGGGVTLSAVRSYVVGGKKIAPVEWTKLPEADRKLIEEQLPEARKRIAQSTTPTRGRIKP